jgi:hypothetical protein
MLKAVVDKEWAEVRRDGRGKVEDWSWSVSFYDAPEQIDLNYYIDRHWYKEEVTATLVAALFEAGDFHYGEYGEIVINKVFA